MTGQLLAQCSLYMQGIKPATSLHMPSPCQDLVSSAAMTQALHQSSVYALFRLQWHACGDGVTLCCPRQAGGWQQRWASRP